MRKFIHIPFVLIVFAVGLLLSHQVAAQSQIPTYVDVQTEAIKGGYRLIEMNELWQLYQQP